MAGVGALWGCFCPPPLCPVRVQMLLPTVVEAVPVAVPCGHDGEPSPTVGNWPVPTEERSWNAKYSITRGILAFVRMRCPVQTGASQMRFQTWFLHLSGIEAQRDLTNRCLTRTCADTHRQRHTHTETEAAVLQSNSNSVVSTSTRFFPDADVPGVSLAAVPYP